MNKYIFHGFFSWHSTVAGNHNTVGTQLSDRQFNVKNSLYFENNIYFHIPMVDGPVFPHGG